MKLIMLLFIIVFSASAGFAQETRKDNDYYVKEDQKARRLTAMFRESDNVVLPDSVPRILKDYAYTKGLHLGTVLKQQNILKILYNTSLSVEDRLFAVDYLIRQFSLPDSYVPAYLAVDMKKYLLSLKKSN